MLIRGEARVTIDLTCALNLKRVSKVTPSMRGVFSSGSREYPIFGSSSDLKYQTLPAYEDVMKIFLFERNSKKIMDTKNPSVNDRR